MVTYDGEEFLVIRDEDNEGNTSYLRFSLSLSLSEIQSLSWRFSFSQRDLVSLMETWIDEDSLFIICLDCSLCCLCANGTLGH